MSTPQQSPSLAQRRGMPDPETLARLQRLREQFVRMQMEYGFAVEEVLTKIEILRQEFLHLHRYNPIEHVSSRVKSPVSILDKAMRRGIDLTPEAIRQGITDIGGVRITCSFIADTFTVLEHLVSQTDIEMVTVKDYIAQPKPNGYKSLHAIIRIPVFLSTGPVPTTVEVQIRTIAMDFWASLEHKIYYKYDGQVPDHLAQSLADAATVADQLDRRMEQQHREVHGPHPEREERSRLDDLDERLLRALWERTGGGGYSPTT